jgi:hypothetical protein
MAPVVRMATRPHRLARLDQRGNLDRLGLPTPQVLTAV